MFTELTKQEEHKHPNPHQTPKASTHSPSFHHPLFQFALLNGYKAFSFIRLESDNSHKKKKDKIFMTLLGDSEPYYTHIQYHVMLLNLIEGSVSFRGRSLQDRLSSKANGPCLLEEDK